MSFIPLLQKIWEKNEVSTNLAQLKYYLSQNNSVGFCRLFLFTLSSFFHSVVLFITREEIIWIFDFTLLFSYVFSLLFSVVVCCFQCRFDLRSQWLTRFCLFKSSQLLSRGKVKNVISWFLISFETSQVEFFLLIVFFYILARHLFNFKNDVLKSGFIHGCGYWAYGLFLCLRSLWLKYFR